MFKRYLENLRRLIINQSKQICINVSSEHFPGLRGGLYDMMKYMPIENKILSRKELDKIFSDLFYKKRK